jgi:hypothetical protein
MLYGYAKGNALAGATVETEADADELEAWPVR